MRRILIVEDSPTMRAMLASALESLGVTKVTEATNGFEALRALPREAFDLIITDINMPDINGLELVSFVKSNAAYRDIPLVIVTTEGSERDREKGVALGADCLSTYYNVVAVGNVIESFDTDPDMLRSNSMDLTGDGQVSLSDFTKFKTDFYQLDPFICETDGEFWCADYNESGAGDDGLCPSREANLLLSATRLFPRSVKHPPRS